MPSTEAEPGIPPPYGPSPQQHPGMPPHPQQQQPPRYHPPPPYGGHGPAPPGAHMQPPPPYHYGGPPPGPYAGQPPGGPPHPHHWAGGGMPPGGPPLPPGQAPPYPPPARQRSLSPDRSGSNWGVYNRSKNAPPPHKQARGTKGPKSEKDDEPTIPTTAPPYWNGQQPPPPYNHGPPPYGPPPGWQGGPHPPPIHATAAGQHPPPPHHGGYGPPWGANPGNSGKSTPPRPRHRDPYSSQRHEMEQHPQHPGSSSSSTLPHHQLHQQQHHYMSRGVVGPQPPLDDDGVSTSEGGSEKDKGRGSYKCGRCGVPKKGHVCPYQPKLKRRPDEPPPEIRNAAIQVEMDEFMTLRRLNIRIQGFPESYATEPYMTESMVVGEPAHSPHSHHHHPSPSHPQQQPMDAMSRTSISSHQRHKQQPEGMVEQRMADTSMHDDETRSNAPTMRDAAVGDDAVHGPEAGAV